MVRSLILLAVLAGCGARAPHGASPRASGGDELTLYRDAALVRQRVEVDVGPAEKKHVRVVLAPGLTADDIAISDRGELSIDVAIAGAPEPDPDDPRPSSPTVVELDVGAPHAGHFVFHLGYVTTLVTWEAAYTMTTTAARDFASLRGAIAIRNASGIKLPHAHLIVVDSELGNWRARMSEDLAAKLIGGTPSTTPIAPPRDVGVVELGTGELRVELLPDDPPRRMHSALVYDPIGTKLDNASPSPVKDLRLGLHPAPPTRISESFEVVRDQRTSVGLPAGPVRLLERRADGSLVVLGESRLFDAATRVADVDTVAIGTAEGVSGHREQREITIDDDAKKLTEELMLTIDNTRSTPVDVVIHEHLYRGQNWTLAYQSANNAAKEGPQQISLRTTVPPKGHSKVLYVVVYSWQ
jgi:hypothetical protein